MKLFQRIALVIAGVGVGVSVLGAVLEQARVFYGGNPVHFVGKGLMLTGLALFLIGRVSERNRHRLAALVQRWSNSAGEHGRRRTSLEKTAWNLVVASSLMASLLTICLMLAPVVGAGVRSLPGVFLHWMLIIALGSFVLFLVLFLLARALEDVLRLAAREQRKEGTSSEDRLPQHINNR